MVSSLNLYPISVRCLHVVYVDTHLFVTAFHLNVISRAGHLLDCLIRLQSMLSFDCLEQRGQPDLDHIFPVSSYVLMILPTRMMSPNFLCNLCIHYTFGVFFNNQFLNLWSNRSAPLRHDGTITKYASYYFKNCLYSHKVAYSI